MHIGKKYTLRQIIWWTRREVFWFVVLAGVPTYLYEVYKFHWLSVPWLPVALIGTAVAFVTGFKNNASYDRLWEARKIWGGIVNESRTWGIMVKDFVRSGNSDLANDSRLYEIHRKLIYRHIAWLTALRHQLREPRIWESMDKAYAAEYLKNYTVHEYEQNKSTELRKLLSDDELDYVLSKSNGAAQIIALQSSDLRTLQEEKRLDEFRYMQLAGVLQGLYDLQGKCERIKNFPYPRQYATFNLVFVWLFIILIPFGMIDEFARQGEHIVWLTIPFTVLVAWVFHTMEKIGEASENPFEGGANDIAMTSLSRTIEIDLREMLEEEDIPPVIEAVNNILM